MPKLISEMTLEERNELRTKIENFINPLLHEKDAMFFVGVSKDPNNPEVSNFLTLTSLPQEAMVDFVKVLLKKYEKDAAIRKLQRTFIRGEDAKSS